MSVPTHDITGEPVAASHERKQRHPLLVWAWSLVRLDFVGIAFGALFFCLSLTPSLLPRDWLFQGLIGGLNAAIGYGIGVFIQKMVRRFVLRRRRWWPPSKRVLYWCKAATITLSTAASLLMLIPAAAWQRRVSAEMGMEGPGTVGYLRTLIIAMLVTGLCVSAARVIIDLIKTMARFFIRRWHLHDEVALFIGTAIVVVLAITLINGVLIRGFLAGANRVFQPQNTTTRAAITQPLDLERVRQPNVFRSVGHVGISGPQLRRHRPARLRADPAERQRPPKSPSGCTRDCRPPTPIEERADILVRELDRTRAFDRKVLVIVPTTGTGWINPVAARALELMYNGDTAMVGSQYSYLPSWISFLGDREKSMESGRTMIDAVHDVVDAAAARPAAQADALRREPRLHGRAGRVQLAPRHRADGFLVGAVGGPAQRQPAVEGDHRAARPGNPRGRAALRQRAHRPVLAGHRCRRDRRRHGCAMGRHPGAVPAARRRTPSSGGRRT